MSTPLAFARLCILMAAAGTTLAGASLQGQPTPVPPSSAAPQPQPAPRPAPEPSLDDLLGLTKPREPAATPAEPAPDADLERALSADNVADDFEQAVDLMGQSAERLAVAKDPGAATQRLQEETLRRLDKLIEDAENRRQRQSSSSSQQRQKPQQQQQQQQQMQQQSAAAQRAAGQQQGDASLPGRQDGQGRLPRAGAGASWGNLPEHIRNALQQGLSDKVSARYRGKTEEYYKRLAEEPKP